jgi:hypothetical protein
MARIVIMDYKMKHLGISLLMILYANYLMVVYAPMTGPAMVLVNAVLGGCLGFSYHLQRPYLN